MVTAYVSCTQCSYEEVARRFGYSLTWNAWKADVCVDDIYMFMRRFPIYKPPCKLIGDTMADVPPNKGWNKTIYTYSRWNYEMLKARGYQVELIDLPPIPHFSRFSDFHKFVMVGVSRFFDRKNIHVLNELKIRDKTVLVSHYDYLPYIKNRRLYYTWLPKPDYEAFSLPVEDLMNLLARSKYYLALSYVEGVGLPAVEAERNGLTVVYLDAHGYHDNIEKGIPIRVCDSYTMNIVGYPFKIWEPCWDNLEEVISELR